MNHPEPPQHAAPPTQPATPPPTHPWTVLRVKPRQEKTVAAILDAANIYHFLPLARTVRYYGHRNRTSLVPLFPGYLFARAQPHEIFKADNNACITQLLQVNDQQQLDRELNSIRIAQSAGRHLVACPPLAVGDAVEITRGPLKGIVGTVQRPGRAQRLVLAVSIVNGAAEMEIDPTLLERTDPAPPSHHP